MTIGESREIKPIPRKTQPGLQWAACRIAGFELEGPRRFHHGASADPRSFCIQKTLQDIAHGDNPRNNNHCLLAGHSAYTRFKQDPFFPRERLHAGRGGKLVERIF